MLPCQPLESASYAYDPRQNGIAFTLILYLIKSAIRQKKTQKRGWGTKLEGRFHGSNTKFIMIRCHILQPDHLIDVKSYDAIKVTTVSGSINVLWTRWRAWLFLNFSRWNDIPGRGYFVFKVPWNASACWFVLIYNTLTITNVAKRLVKYVPYILV